ncbi:MAG: radical SAM family heme chaperone HemW [Candidatus Thiodiazotropha sp. (ex Myrtea sp. 'scaly one' KF741663)]|nr:radical SAM family heme chaperone HemW [Candidatus Thiodiazotropha sp. (ex Myrtea sp. 'scaly one' KF741663)]
MKFPPLSLYIHIPWCVRKCPYCDFNSHAVGGALDESAYVDALLTDLALEAPLTFDRPLQSIFIGGGTPSLFTPAAIGRLLAGVRDQLALDESIEVTMEANPGALETDYFTGYRDAGVNRLSLGVQSFHDESLQALGRIHSAAEAVRAVERAKEAGFARINLDLMFGLPMQTHEMAMADLQTAIDLATEHLSYYQLTLEPNTRFHQQPPKLPMEDLIWEMQQAGQKLLVNAGFEQYEISAFARPGGQCLHNLNYWRFGDYLGIGAGAHAKVTRIDGNIERRWKQRHPGSYLSNLSQGDALLGSRELLPEDRVIEFMMNALRLTMGVERPLFQQMTDVSLNEISEALSEAKRLGLLSPDSERLYATPLGLKFLNDLLGLFRVND